MLLKCSSLATVDVVKGHLRERGKGSWELRVFVGRDPVTRRDRYKTKTFKGGKRAAEQA